jgi:hypothetical protein
MLTTETGLRRGSIRREQAMKVTIRSARMFLALVVGSAAIPRLLGCRAAQLGMDQGDMRQALLALYTDQVMDNLVRARNNLPIIHLDYSNITGTVTQSGGGEFADTQIEGTNRLGATPGKDLPEAITFPERRTFSNTLNWRVNVSQMNQLTLTAQPVISSQAVYDAYLDFLAVADRLRDSKDNPVGPVHIKKKFQGRYYWVPQEYAADFFRLSLLTTCLRGDAVPSPRDFACVVEGVVSTREISGGGGHEVTLRLKKPVPNDNGELRVTIKGRERLFTVHPIEGDEEKPRGAPTDQFILVFVASEYRDLTLDQLVEGLEDKPISLRLENHRPANSRTQDLLESIRHQMELFRLDQQAR